MSNLLFTLINAQNQEEIVGVWLTQDKDAHIEFSIGEDGSCEGKVIWLRDAIDKDTGLPPLDKHNPDPTKRKEPILGLTTFTDFSFNSSKNQWENGKAYDPKVGKSYDGKLWVDKGILKMRGYIGWFFRTENWTRVK